MKEINKIRYVPLCLVLGCAAMMSCQRDPMLYLHEEGKDLTVEIPIVNFDLPVIWDYQLEYGVEYDWKAEWQYQWDATDEMLFGKLGYTEPSTFNIRRYFTGDTPNGPHGSPYKHSVSERYLSASYEFGYWDILAWTDIHTSDGIQSVTIDESSNDEVIAYTNETMVSAPHYSTRFTRAFYQPEEFFAGYEKAININKNLDGFVFDADRNSWVRNLTMSLQPMTYIYLMQVILHHNNRNGRIITAIDGNANLSGMARSVVLNTGVTGSDAITVNFDMRLKKDQAMQDGTKCDIVGGKVVTFGIPKINPSSLSTRSYEESLKAVGKADLNNRHYFDVTMQFSNGKDSTFVFDITDKVRKLYRGGVITIELDMDTIPVPNRNGGSGFDAVIKDFEEKQWEFDM